MYYINEEKFNQLAKGDSLLVGIHSLSELNSLISAMANTNKANGNMQGTGFSNGEAESLWTTEKDNLVLLIIDQRNAGLGFRYIGWKSKREMSDDEYVNGQKFNIYNVNDVVINKN